MVVSRDRGGLPMNLNIFLVFKEASKLSLKLQFSFSLHYVYHISHLAHS